MRENDRIFKSFIARISHLLIEQGKKKSQLAYILNLSRSNFGNKMSGKTGFTLDDIINITRYFEDEKLRDILFEDITFGNIPQENFKLSSDIANVKEIERINEDSESEKALDDFIIYLQQKIYKENLTLKKFAKILGMDYGKLLRRIKFGDFRIYELQRIYNYFKDSQILDILFKDYSIDLIPDIDKPFGKENRK